MAALAYVRGAQQNSTVNGGTTIATAAAVLTAGNRLFVYVGHVAGTGGEALAAITISDTAGNTFVPVGTHFGTQARSQWFYVANALGHASNVISVTFDRTVFARAIRSYELSGDVPVSITQTANEQLNEGSTLTLAAPGATVGTGGVILAGVNGYPDMGGIGTQTWNQSVRDPLTVAGSLSGGFTSTMYALVPSGTRRKGFTASSPSSLPTNGYRAFNVLSVDIGGALPADVGTNVRDVQLTAEAVTFPSNPALRLIQSATEALTRPSAPKLRLAQTSVEVAWVQSDAKVFLTQCAVEVLRSNTAQIVNDRDKLLQATSPRYTGGGASLILTASPGQVSEGVNSTITFTATRIGVGTGLMVFTTAYGSPLTIVGDTATLQSTDMVNSLETVTATVQDGENTYNAYATVTESPAAPGPDPLDDANGNPVPTLQNTVLPYYRLSGYNIDCSNLADPTAPAVKAMGLGSPAVLGEGYSGMENTHGVRGTAATAQGGASPISSGIVGAQNGYDFYADGASANYGPFTGSHDALLDASDGIEVGDIVVDVLCMARNGYSNTLFLVGRSSQPNQAAVLGILSTPPRPLDDTVPAVFVRHAWEVADEGPSKHAKAVRKTAPEHGQLATQGYRIAAVNAVGEGQLNVVGEGGDIAAGDLIVASSTPGKGMKQKDNVVRSYTVARAREGVKFNKQGNEVKTIACIYLAG